MHHQSPPALSSLPSHPQKQHSYSHAHAQKPKGKRVVRCHRCVPRTRKFRTAKDLALHILTAHRTLRFEGVLLSDVSSDVSDDDDPVSPPASPAAPQTSPHLPASLAPHPDLDLVSVTDESAAPAEVPAPVPRCLRNRRPQCYATSAARTRAPAPAPSSAAYPFASVPTPSPSASRSASPQNSDWSLRSSASPSARLAPVRYEHGRAGEVLPIIAPELVDALAPPLIQPALRSTDSSSRPRVNAGKNGQGRRQRLHFHPKLAPVMLQRLEEAKAKRVAFQEDEHVSFDFECVGETLF
jgi:hypothetical protein